MHEEQDLLTRFKAYLLNQDHSPATIRAYLSDLSIFCEWLKWLHEGEAFELAQANKTELKAFRKHLIHEKGHKAATVNRRIQSIRQFYQFLSEQGIIPHNIAEGLRFIRRQSRKQPKGLKRREVLILLRAIEKSSSSMVLRNQAIIQLMLQTGLRVGEVSSLKQSDILIRDRSGLVSVREGKGKKMREIPLNAAARRALSLYVNSLPAERKGISKPLFFSKQGSGLTVRGLQKLILALVRQTELKDKSVSAHTLRHTFALNYLKSNPGKLVELAHLMGHESLDTTAIYTQPSEEDLLADLERSDLNTFEP